MDRRRFLEVAGVAALASGVFRRADFASASLPVASSPYGPLLPADANGLELPAGFTSRVVARTGEVVTPNSTSTWHSWPDGGACFTMPDGGWVYCSNSEIATGGGGVGAVRFDATGGIIDAYRILSSTSRNCAGGPTPWGTWLSCEETDTGQVWECDPRQPGQGTLRAALGTFRHEAAAVDPVTGFVYLTEDAPTGRLYRFVPAAGGDLSSGELSAATVTAGVVSWVPTSPLTPDRQAATTVFNGGEGAWVDGRRLYFSTKGDNRIWELELDSQALSILYQFDPAAPQSLSGVDNITVHPTSGDLFISEDGGNMEICVIPLSLGVRQPTPLLRLPSHPTSELTGPAFSPDGRRLYFSSQRGTIGSGITYEITGPFRRQPPPPPLGPFEVVMPRGSSWRYFTGPTAPPATWALPNFDDSAWSSGAAPLGYGDPVATVIPSGPTGARFPAAYFRAEFTAARAFADVRLRLRRDDGAVVYLNGVQVGRSNMPTGTIGHTTPARVTVSGAGETTYFELQIARLVRAGRNTIAVEVHQDRPTSSDLVMDVEVMGRGTIGSRPTPPPEPLVVRGGSWRYHSTGVAPPPEWRSAEFDDSAWLAGPAPLGFGDPVATLIDSGPAGVTHTTSYFRATFASRFSYEALQFELRYDDGIVVHLDEVEVHRSNMPIGPIDHSTAAASDVEGAAESAYTTAVASTPIVAGTHTLAVEVHQSSPASDDLQFDLALFGLGNVQRVRL